MTTDIRERVAEVVGSIHFSDWSDVQDRVTDAVVDALLEAFPQLAEEQWEYSRMNDRGNVCEPDLDLEDARVRAEQSTWPGSYNQVVRRRRAGEWEVCE